MHSIRIDVGSDPIFVQREFCDVGEEGDESVAELTDLCGALTEHRSNLLFLVDQINRTVGAIGVQPVGDIDEEVKFAFHGALRMEKKKADKEDDANSVLN